MRVIKSLLASRKFWLMVLGILVPVLNAKLNLQMDSVALAGALAVIFANILGIAIEDAGEKSAGGLLQISPPAMEQPREQRGKPQKQ